MHTHREPKEHHSKATDDNHKQMQQQIKQQRYTYLFSFIWPKSNIKPEVENAYAAGIHLAVNLYSSHLKRNKPRYILRDFCELVSR